jgi:hypothetical protein
MIIRKLAVSFGVLTLFVACDNQPTAIAPATEAPASLSAHPSAMNQALAAVRAATARYQDVEVAVRDGFTPITACIEHPQLGGMGFHYARPDRMDDADYVATEPEMLLYVPRADGSLQLVGVEYWIREHAWAAAGRTGFPMFLYHPFDHTPAMHGMPARYSLHVWVWQPNPSGVFAPFNPRVSC